LKSLLPVKVEETIDIKEEEEIKKEENPNFRWVDLKDFG